MVGLTLVALLIARLTGWSVLPILLIGVYLYVRPFEAKLPVWLVIFGVLIDVVMGRLLGVSSLLLLLTYFEIALYKEKVTTSGGWQLFLIGLLSTAQTMLFWRWSVPWWQYPVNGLLSFGWWFILQLSDRHSFGSGVYLRKGN